MRNFQRFVRLENDIVYEFPALKHISKFLRKSTIQNITSKITNCLLLDFHNIHQMKPTGFISVSYSMNNIKWIIYITVCLLFHFFLAYHEHH